MKRVIPPRMNSATVTQDTGPRASLRSIRPVWRDARTSVALPAASGTAVALTPTVLPY
jgi:hypothetical protein